MTEEFMRTLRGTLSSGRTGIASLLGDEEAQALAGLERSEAISQDYGVAPSLEQVKETYDEEGLLAAIAEGARQVPRFVTQQLPTLAQAIAGAKVGAMVPGPPQLKAAGAIAGGIGAFLPTFAGSNIERLAQEQQEAGEAIDVDVGGAYGTAIAQSGLQGVGAAAVLGKNIVRGVLGIAAKDVPEEVAERELRTLAERGVLQNIARRGATGAAGEVPTEVAQQVLERNYAGLPLADEEAMAEYGEAAYASAIGGGVLGGATGINDRRINRNNLEAFEAAQRTATVPVVGADNAVRGRMTLTQNPDGSVVRQDFDAEGNLTGTSEYSGEQAANIFTYGKGKERGRAPVNENDLASQGFKADEKKEETPPEKTEEMGEPGATPSEADVDAALAGFEDRFSGIPDAPVKPLTARQLAIQAEIEAEAAKQGVTLTPEDLRKTVLFAQNRNDADRPGDIAKQVTKKGKPITPATDTEVTPPTDTTPPPVTPTGATSTTGTTDSTRFDAATINRELEQHQRAIQTEIEAEAARLGVTLTPKDLRSAINGVSNNTFRLKNPDISRYVAQQIANFGKPITPPAPSVTPTATTPPTDTTPPVTLQDAEAALGVSTTPDKTRSQKALESDDLGRVYDALYEEDRNQNADPAFVQQLKDRANELYAQKYPGLAAEEKVELDTLYREHSQIGGTDAFTKTQKKEMRSKIMDRIADLEQKQVAPAPEVSEKLQAKRVEGVSKEAIPAMKEDKETTNRELNKARRSRAFKPFSKYLTENANDLDVALRVLAYDLVTLDPKGTKFDKRDYNAAVKAQAWVNGTLSKPANRALEAQVAEFKAMQDKGTLRTQKIDAAIERNRAARKAERDAFDAYNEETTKIEREPTNRQLKANKVDLAQDIVEDADVISAEVRAEEQALLDDLGLETDYLAADAVATSSMPLTETQIGIAERGDLSGVMQNIEDTTDNKDVRQLAKALKANIGDTKLEVVDGLKGANGKQVAGLFDPKTNTIKLNSRVMLRPHTIMHETAHAATSHTLKNKSHPVTKALTKLFDDVKSQLDTEYGATSLDEFVAEVFSNVEFRQKLAAIMVPAGDGKQITAFQRFKNAVGNLLRTLMGKPTVSLDRKEDALTQADALIRNILSPAPNVRNAPELYSMLAAGGKESETVMRVMLAPFRGASTKIDPQALAKARAVLAPMSRARVQAMTYLLPLNAQIEIAKDIIPSAKDLFEVLQRKKGTRDNEMQKVTDLNQILERAFKNKLEQRNTFNDIVAYSTLAKVDPSLTEAEAKKKYGKDKERMAAYEDMTKNYWSKLSDAQRKAYKELRDYYAGQYEKIRKLIDTRIEEFAMDGDQKAKLKDLLLKDVLSKESIEPYFPLARSGKFWLEYSGVSPFTGKVEHYKESFDSETERDLAREEQRNNTTRINQLKARWTGTKEQLEKALEVQSYERAQNDSKLEKVPTGFAYRILNEMKATNAPADVQKMITEMLLNAMPENSLARMFKPRAGTMGFKVDALTVLQDRSPSIITQVTNLEFDGPLSKLLTKMKADVEKSDDPHKQVWLESFTSYIDYSRSPFIAPWSRRLKSLGFMFTLGFNVSSVLVNMTNPAVVTYPYLGGQFGFDKALKAMLNAHSVYMGAGGKKTGIPYVTKRRSSYDLKHMDKLNEEGKNDGVETEIFSAPNLSNIDFSDLSKVPKEYRHYGALEEAMRNRGQSNRSLLTEINEFADPKIGVLGKLDGYMAKVTNLSGLMFHQGERMNRSVSAIAAYNLKLEDLLKGRPVSSATAAEMAKAADYAIEATELTNSGSMAETAPRISQGSLGSVVFMYKRFGVSMLYLQVKMLNQALRAGKFSKEERRVAKRQILGLFLTSGAIAGIRGMPAVGIIITLWNMFQDEDEEDADTILQNYVGEGPFNGVLNYVFGLDIAPRIGMTDLLFRSLPNQESTSLADTAFNMAGPIAGIANRVYGGWGLMMDGEIARGAERMAPAVIAGGMKAARYWDEGATTLRGDPITEDINPGHVLGQAFGFAPAGYTRQLERNALDKRVDRNISQSRTRLMRRYYLAMRENDFNALLDVQQEMLDFSLKHPEVAITPDSIAASIRQHRVTDEMARQLGGITVNRRRLATVMQERMEAGF
jgi:hypothetical protein